jgi:6-pyruvoyltetrahydropterin/6-carboxytetrahydropterin synthase
MSDLLRIWRTHSFEAAHHLPRMPEGHKCRNMHGHSYKMTTTLHGLPDSAGIIVDTAELDRCFEEDIHELLDHKVLNEVPGLENPTTELLAMWCWERMNERFGEHSQVRSITVSIDESPRSGASFSSPP